MKTARILTSLAALSCSVAPALEAQVIDLYGGLRVGSGASKGFYDPRASVPLNEQQPAVSMGLAQGEYESAMFTVAANSGGLNDVTVSISNLSNGVDQILASDIDVRTVKWWYQSDKWNPQRLYVPELLLHNSGVVSSVNHVAQSNTLAFDMNTIHDEAAIQPLDIANQNLNQYWLTLKGPDNISAGAYAGTVTVSASNAAPNNIPIQVNLRPYALQETDKVFGVYDQIWLDSSGYMINTHLTPLGGLGAGEGSSIMGNTKSWGQYIKDLTIMEEYGITHPAHYSDPRLQIIPLRSMAGPPVAGQPYFSIYGATNKADSEIIRVRDEAFAAGATEVYIALGIDEPFTVPQLQQSIPEIQNAHSLGVKVFGALAGGAQDLALQYLGGLLDVPLFKLVGSNTTLDGWKAVSDMVLGISYPHSFDELPAELRQNYGFGAWARGLDGILSYDYQTSYGGGNVWDDFDCGGTCNGSTGWDMNMVYKVASGDPVPTLQLAAFREAHDDMRYMATLESVLAPAEILNPADPNVVLANTYLADLQNDLDGWSLSLLPVDMNHVRDDIVTLIDLLSGNTPAAMTWAVNANGNWSESPNWASHALVPDGSDFEARFSDVNTAPRIVVLDSSFTTASMVFDSPNAYTVFDSIGSQTLTLQSSGGAATISVNQGSHVINAAAMAASDINVDVAGGASLAFSPVLDLDLNGRTLTKSGTGALTLGDVTGGGDLVVADGLLTVNGTHAGGAVDAVLTGATLGGDGLLVVPLVINSGTVAPGNSVGSLFVAGDFLQTATGLLEFEIGGTSNHDVLTVTGTLTAEGTLRAILTGGFTPQMGDQFDVLNLLGGASGTFDTLDLPALTAGLAWDADNLLTTGNLEVIAQALLLGDADNDGAVTADDLIAVQQNFGNIGPNGDGTDLGDANDDGAVTADDLVAVQQNFGNTLGAAAGNPVPEPATAAMLVLGALAAQQRGRRAARDSRPVSRSRDSGPGLQYNEIPNGGPADEVR